MSTNNYNFYSVPPPLPPLPPPLPPPPPPPNDTHPDLQDQPPQRNWKNQQHSQNYGRTTRFQPNHVNPHNVPPPHRFYNTPPPRHFPPRGRYSSNTSYGHTPYVNTPYVNTQQNWLRTNHKRPNVVVDDYIDPKGRVSKKKKKPLSQNVPSRKDWTFQEASIALETEKDYNKRFKNHSLIIKFPDLELNKEIVSSFHKAIENVHFQQPSTARFCFVTLQESANRDEVISTLNQQEFGDGLLTAEYKKDRDDEQNIGADDIDPLTLYVGNLAQEITKEDMVRAFPRCRRIDIGYAKKMKYTRYAFVTFKNVSESIEAFKQTHSTEMYSKSLIVRFRRLERRRNKTDELSTVTEESASTSGTSSCPPSSISNASDSSTAATPEIDLTLVKDEPTSDDDEKKPCVETNYESPFLPGPLEQPFIRHRPIVKTEVKAEIKQEVPAEKPVKDTGCNINFAEKKIKEECLEMDIKDEPVDDDFDDGPGFFEYPYEDSDAGDDDILERSVDFDQFYKDMVHHASVVSSLKHVNKPS